MDALYLNLATQNHPQEQDKIAWEGGELSFRLRSPRCSDRKQRIRLRYAPKEM